MTTPNTNNCMNNIKYVQGTIGMLIEVRVFEGTSLSFFFFYNIIFLNKGSQNQQLFVVSINIFD